MTIINVIKCFARIFGLCTKKYKNLSKNLFELSILFSPQDIFS